MRFKNATPEEMKQLSAISQVLAKDPKLFDILFDPYKPELRAAPQVLLKSVAGMSSTEIFLIKICIDLWSQEGHAMLSELLWRVDRERFDNILIAMALLGPKHTSPFLQNFFFENSDH